MYLAANVWKELTSRHKFRTMMMVLLSISHPCLGIRCFPGSMNRSATPAHRESLFCSSRRTVVIWARLQEDLNEAQPLGNSAGWNSHSVLRIFSGICPAEFVRGAGWVTVTSTGATTVNGNLGISPGSALTGFPPGVVANGTIHQGDAVAAQAQTDLTTVYNQLAGDACSTDLTGQNLGGLTLTPGVYCFATSAQLTGMLTLDAQGTLTPLSFSRLAAC